LPSVAELPEDAMQPLPSQRLRAPMQPSGGQSQQPDAPIALPGQGLVVLPPGGSPGTVRPPPPSSPMNRAPAPGIRPGGALPTQRLAAQGAVGFDQARKAEKIFEQALKDHAEGRLSSARMNAKLATQFDPSTPAYKDFLDSLDAVAPKPGSVKPRELVLFEQASDAEGRGDYDKAAKLLQQAIDINGKAAALYNRLGVVLSIRLKRHEEALAHLKRAIELEPGSLVYMNNFSKVTAMLESALEKDPEARKGKGKQNEKVAIKKMRPKMF
jgi:tetratricopeptide (TPR) repeat protein